MEHRCRCSRYTKKVMSHEATENVYQLREDWLKEHGRTENDVLEDSMGEFIFEIDENEQGTPGDDYQFTVKTVRTYLPSNLKILE